MNCRVILYYNFTTIDDPAEFCRQHKQLCEQLELKGRIYIAPEGINGTIAGERDAVEQYQAVLRSIDGFADTQFKEDDIDSVPFERLIVKTRPEIVTLKSSVPVDPVHHHGKYLDPHEWRAVMESKEDYVMIDVRNNYESVIGHFEGALLPDVENFYDFPQWLDSVTIDKNKKVLVYCTGGIRCEKFSLFMEAKGFKDVYQLHGGILNYAKKEQGAHFKGKCFVFDDRLEVPVNKKEKGPISKCRITGIPCDTYINCANMDCNNLFLCSPQGAMMMDGCCSEECRKSKWRRPLNVDDIYAPSKRWYNYYDDKSQREE